MSSDDKSVCHDECVKRWWYTRPLTLGVESYVIDFDKQGRVLGALQMSSP